MDNSIKTINNMNAHNGKRVQEIAKSQGFNAYDLSKLINKTRQTVEYHFTRPVIKRDLLNEYAKILNVDVQEFYKEIAENKQIRIQTDEYLSKYLKAVEKIDFLQSILLKNGIKVEMPNFSWGVSVSVFGRMNNHIFFNKRIQKRTHPMQHI